MDVEYIEFVFLSWSYGAYANYDLFNWFKRNKHEMYVTEKIAISVFLVAGMNMPPRWTFPIHKAGSWYDEHLEYSNRLN